MSFAENWGRALGNNLSASPISTSGHTWVKYTGPTATWTGDLISSSGPIVRPTLSATGCYLCGWTPPSADYSWTHTFKRNGTTGASSSMAIRWDTAADAFYRFTIDHAGAWQVVRRSGGTNVTLASGTGGWSGTDCAVVFGMVADKIKYSINGTAQTDITDATLTAAGQLGIFGANYGSTADFGPMTADVVAVADTTAPTLTSPVGAQTGTSTASGGVTTNEANGTIYAVCTTSGTAPTVTQVKAGQDNAGVAAAYATTQAISTTGAKTFAATGLAASTAYFWHFVHTDAAANNSTVSSSATFTTAAPDTTAPTLTSPVGAQTGTTTASGGVTTNEANGTLYAVCTVSATAPTAAQVKLGQNQAGAAAAYASNQAVTTTGAKTVAATGLTSGTAYWWHFVHRDAAGNDSAVSSSASFTTASSDTTAPTLTSPTGAQTGTTTASGSVSTNEANGTVYAVVTTSATAPTAAQIRAGQNNTGTAAAYANSAASSATGVKNFSATGLTASTAYWWHFHHRDAANNDSAVVSSATFTTAAPADTTAPTLSAAVSAQTGTTTGTGGVTTNEANGTLYAVCTTSATAPSVAQVKAGQNNAGTAAVYASNQAISAVGAKTFTATGLTAATVYYWHFVHTDAASNNSAVATSPSFTTAAATGSFTSSICLNNSETAALAGAACSYALHVGATMADYTNLGAFPPQTGTGTLDGAGRLTKSGHTLGVGLLLMQSGTDSFLEQVTVV